MPKRNQKFISIVIYTTLVVGTHEYNYNLMVVDCHYDIRDDYAYIEITDGELGNLPYFLSEKTKLWQKLRSQIILLSQGYE